MKDLKKEAEAFLKEIFPTKRIGAMKFEVSMLVNFASQVADKREQENQIVPFNEFQRRVWILAAVEKAIDKFSNEWKSHEEARAGKQEIVMEIDTIFEDELFDLDKRVKESFKEFLKVLRKNKDIASIPVNDDYQDGYLMAMTNIIAIVSEKIEYDRF